MQGNVKLSQDLTVLTIEDITNVFLNNFISEHKILKTRIKIKENNDFLKIKEQEDAKSNEQFLRLCLM